MNIHSAVKQKIRGEVELFYRFPDRDEVILQKRNTILYGGMDLAAKAIAGKQFINGMYLAYENSAAPISEPTPPPELTAAYYQTTGSTDPRGFVRVATLAEPSFDSTDAQYNNNKAIFVGISTSEVAIADGSNAVTDGVSQFYGAALAYLDPDDLTNDRLRAQ
jgi:hypothetical protein